MRKRTSLVNQMSNWWTGRTVIQRFVFIVSVVIALTSVGCAIVSVVALIQPLVKGWFIPCADKAAVRAVCSDQVCICCSSDRTACNKNGAFFCIYRVYAVVFAVLSLLSEIKLTIFQRYFKFFTFMIGRSLLQGFVGVMVANSVPYPPEAQPGTSFPMPYTMLDLAGQIFGYSLLGLAVVQFILGLSCFNQFTEDSEEHSLDDRKEPHVKQYNDPRISAI